MEAKRRKLIPLGMLQGFTGQVMSELNLGGKSVFRENEGGESCNPGGRKKACAEEVHYILGTKSEVAP